MASRARLDGAVRLARTTVNAPHATFLERELAWAVLRLAGALKVPAEGVSGGISVRPADRGVGSPP